MIGDCRSIC